MAMATIDTPTNVRGSPALIPYSKLCKTRPSASALTMPIAHQRESQTVFYYQTLKRSDLPMRRPG